MPLARSRNSGVFAFDRNRLPPATMVDSIPDNLLKHKKLSPMPSLSPKTLAKRQLEIERLSKSADPRLADFVAAIRNRYPELRP
jgi:hypothetical protein